MSAARNKRRRYRKRGRFGFLYKMLAVIAVMAAVFMGATVFFRVETVTVAGTVRYTQQQVEEASGVLQGDNLFRLNKYEIARQIRRELPYVEAVNIRRSLPDKLIIAVTECRAAAWLRDGSWLISASGKVLEYAGTARLDVPEVVGLSAVQPVAGENLIPREEQQLRADSLTALLQALEQCGMQGRAKKIDLSSKARILMELDDRFTAYLPMGGDFVYLLSAMEKAIQTLEPYEKGTLDLTVKDYTVIFSPT